jgi:hypothetical protein
MEMAVVGGLRVIAAFLLCVPSRAVETPMGSPRARGGARAQELMTAGDTHSISRSTTASPGVLNVNVGREVITVEAHVLA